MKLPRHWYPRLIIAMWAGHIPVVTWLSPDSLSGRAVAGSGVGALCMLVLAIAAVVAVLDVIVNDVLPDNFHLGVMHRRHVGYMAMALALLMLAGIVGTIHGPTAILFTYILPAAFAIGITWLDLFTRHAKAPA